MNKIYLGFRDENGDAHIIVVETANDSISRCGPIPHRNDLADLSQGLEWGYLGAGPSQAALALLADLTGDGELALHYYERFRNAVVGSLPKSHFLLTGLAIQNQLDLWMAKDRRIKL